MRRWSWPLAFARQGAIAPAIKQQRIAVMLVIEGQHAADENHMVTAVMARFDFALEVRQRFLQDRQLRRALRAGLLGHRSFPFAREAMRKRLRFAVEHIDAEV